MDMINDFILGAATSSWLPLVMFLVALVDGFFPPVPSETVLVAAAAAAASTGDNIVLVTILAALGAMIGDNIAYAIGRKVGSHRFAWMRRPRVAATFERASAGLSRNGAGLILGARYIPVGRVAVNMSAGALRYRWPRFLLLSMIGGLSWAAYSAGIGLVAGRWLEGQPLLSAAFGVGFALALGLLLDRITAARRRRASVANENSDVEEARNPERVA